MAMDDEESENEMSESDEEESEYEIDEEDLKFGKLIKQDQQRVLKLVKVITSQKKTLEKQEDLLIKKIEDLKKTQQEKEELELKITNLNLKFENLTKEVDKMANVTSHIEKLEKKNKERKDWI